VVSSSIRKKISNSKKLTSENWYGGYRELLRDLELRKLFPQFAGIPGIECVCFQSHFMEVERSGGSSVTVCCCVMLFYFN
jgi:hypothetical protein